MRTIPNLSNETSALLAEKETPETTALAARRFTPGNERNKLFCRYYKKDRQTIQGCWTLHKKPGERKPPRPNNS